MTFTPRATMPIPYIKTSQLGDTARPRQWVWDGLLAPGLLTLLTSVCKSGKTTLLAHLIAQRKTGGDIAGRRVAAGPSAIVTEEPDQFWHERNVRLGFRSDDSFFCRPFVNRPTTEQWLELLDTLHHLHKTDGVDLAIIDTLASFLPDGSENYGPFLLDALMPLRNLADAGVAVMLLHHPSKAPSAEGMTARGSGVLPAYFDIVTEMYRVKPDSIDDRRRRLLCFSREPASPRSLAIELNAEGTAYTVVDEPTGKDDLDFHENWTALRIVLDEARNELTRQEIHAAWPDTFPTPSLVTIWHWCRVGLRLGLICCLGAGKPNDPYRYYLPEKAADWVNDPLYQLTKQSRESARNLEAFFKRGASGKPA